MKNTSLKSKISAGFSLVELLVVIAVIGVIAAIAIPNIGNINDSANEATAKRNAQSIASVYSAAQAAGYGFALDKATDLADITDDDGVTINGGPFNNKKFIVPNLSPTDIEAASAYLDDSMNYNPNPDTTTTTTGGTTGG